MSSITTIQSGDQISNSRSVINTNFANLNSDKVETSVIDTDTALTANSDAKIPSQKAVKAYVDTGGNVNASTTNKGIVELATAAEITSGASTGGSGAALVVTPDALKSSQMPIVRTYLNAGSPATWTKPAGLKYVVVEVQGGGSPGGDETDSDSTSRGGVGGRAGGYSKKTIAAATLGATETVTTGAAAGNSSFGAHCFGNGDGTASGGDINITGAYGERAPYQVGGTGGSCPLGTGGLGATTADTNGGAATGYGAGGGGGANSGTPSGSGGAGAPGIVIVTEYYV